MMLRELESIYRISDPEDSGYAAWFGTGDDIVYYLREQRQHIHGYDEIDGWVRNLERYGLTFEQINLN